MTRILTLLATLTLTTACQDMGGRGSDEALAGAVMGGIAGGVVGEDKNRERNVVLGAAAGAAIGNAAGNADTCTYRNTATGERFQAPCGSY